MSLACVNIQASQRTARVQSGRVQSRLHTVSVVAAKSDASNPAASRPGGGALRNTLENGAAVTVAETFVPSEDPTVSISRPSGGFSRVSYPAIDNGNGNNGSKNNSGSGGDSNGGFNSVTFFSWALLYTGVIGAASFTYNMMNNKTEAPAPAAAQPAPVEGKKKGKK